ncbi:MAG TPA: threonine ammonia-lyase, biosynthetic [Burkholderiaceae bacterium]|nr:threonine ammonia-lyase, biosynthetic [Burkholderiaceae bacterium]
MPAQEYLRRVLTARVYDVAIESPLELAPGLSERLSNRVLLKREDLQPIKSFKLRGAYNRMARLSHDQLKRGVIAASAGNHAQGVALAAQKLECRALIVMPVTTPEVKVDAVRARGAEVVLFGDSYSDAYTRALALQRKLKLTFVHPFDDPDVIAGQGTIAMEILRQHHPVEHGPMHAIFVAIGGGGLIAGVAAYIKALAPQIKVIGVQATDSDAMVRSLDAGRRVALREVGLFSDGTAVREVGQHTFGLIRDHVDDIVRVDTDAICAAIKDVFQDTRSILEPAGALSIAGMKAYVQREKLKQRTLVAIASGANMNFDRLRFVAERTEVGEAREALFAVTIPEERGSFKRFCRLVGNRSVTEFNYRISDSSVAHVFVGIGTASAGDNQTLARQFRRHGYATVDLTHDELAAEHVRYMVGGKSLLAAGELIYRFEFPERPGALMKFLTSMAPSWNISMFHYRNQGADYSRVLVGLQMPANERGAFNRFLAALGYRYWNETENPAYRLFLS